MTTRKRTLALFAVLGSVFLLWTPASAQTENESFGIAAEPEEADGDVRDGFAIPLEPGAIFEDAVRIYNRTAQTLDLVVYAADAEAALDDTITVGFRTSRPKGVGSWIDLSRGDIELPPRGEVVVTFRVEVKSNEPSPNLGAIVVENTARGASAETAQREHLVVRTVSANTDTTSVRVRPMLLRSPWVIVAILGLIVAAALVWIGARRARHPKDVVVPAGELDQADAEPEVIPDASRPVIKRLGAADSDGSRTSTGVLDPSQTERADERPLLDDALLVEVDPSDERFDDSLEFESGSYDDDPDDDSDDEADLPPARKKPSAPRKRKPAAAKRKPAAARRKTNAKARSDGQRKTSSTAKRKATRSSNGKKAASRKKGGRAGAAPNFIPLDEL